MSLFAIYDAPPHSSPIASGANCSSRLSFSALAPIRGESLIPVGCLGAQLVSISRCLANNPLMGTFYLIPLWFAARYGVIRSFMFKKSP